MRRSAVSTFALAAAAAFAVAGCSGTPEMVENIKEGNYFQKPVFSTPDWARARPSNREGLSNTTGAAWKSLTGIALVCL